MNKIGPKSLALMSAIALVSLPTYGKAESCSAQIEGLVQRYDIDASPAKAPTPARPQPSVDSADLAQSGGIVRPPATTAGKVIEPPRGVDPGMKTLPDIDHKSVATPGRLNAADRATLETIVVAAKNDARRGDERACLAKLEKSRHLISEASQN